MRDAQDMCHVIEGLRMVVDTTYLGLLGILVWIERAAYNKNEKMELKSIELRAHSTYEDWCP